MNKSITAISLTQHRIDIKFADYIATALDCSREITNETKFMFITNGMYNPESVTQDSRTMNILNVMKDIPSVYFIDDHTCWIPNEKVYPLCTIYSQFTMHPLTHRTYKYFQVSELALFDELFDTLKPTGNDKDYCLGYWGQYKEERYEQYLEYIPAGSTVIGRRYPTSLADEWEMVPFTKNLDELNKEISKLSHTIVFGDKWHNGVNLPYRIYEALMNGVWPQITDELIGKQTIDIGWITKYIKGDDKGEGLYKEKLEVKRELLGLKLESMIPNETVADIVLKDWPEDKQDKLRFIKDDASKPRISLMEPAFIVGVSKVLTFGAVKYGVENWKNATSEDVRRVKDALLRHIYAYLGGEKIDKDSGLSHLYHIGCNTMFLDYFDRQGVK